MHSNTEANPFQAVSLDGSTQATQQLIDFAPILHRWERYRLWYNGVLGAHTLLWTAAFSPDLFQDSLFWFHICLAGLVCNLCFFTGPALEGYGRYFGMWTSFLSLILFMLGLIFTGLLATLFLIVRTR